MLNPLSIYVSSVWGQYEASTISFIVLGFVFLYRKEADDLGGVSQDFKAALAFAVATMIELVGADTTCLPASQIAVHAATEALDDSRAPESAFASRRLSSGGSSDLSDRCPGAVGASSVLLLGQPHTPYALLSNFPGVAALHPLIFILLGLAVVFVWRKKFDLQSVLTYTMVAFVCFMLLSATQPQWWLFILPLGFMYRPGFREIFRGNLHAGFWHYGGLPDPLIYPRLGLHAVW